MLGAPSSKQEAPWCLEINAADNWSGEAKFAAVLHTSTLSEYCRSKGLYPEQIATWRQACITGQLSAQAQRQAEREQARADKKRIAELERDLRRKDKASAETAAILVLRKMMNAFWGRDNDDALPRCQNGYNSLSGLTMPWLLVRVKQWPVQRSDCHCAACCAGR